MPNNEGLTVAFLGVGAGDAWLLGEQGAAVRQLIDVTDVCACNGVWAQIRDARGRVVATVDSRGDAAVWLVVEHGVEGRVIDGPYLAYSEADRAAFERSGVVERRVW